MEKEKERLIKEHANQLEGFLHPDLVERAKKIANYQINPNKTFYSEKFQLWHFHIFNFASILCDLNRFFLFQSVAASKILREFQAKKVLSNHCEPIVSDIESQ